MQRTFTIELTAAEALTLHRMARLSGIPVEKLVRSFCQASVLSALVRFSTGVWHWYDERTRRYVRNRKRDQQQFVAWTADFVRGVGIEPQPRKPVQALSCIAPRQA